MASAVISVAPTLSTSWMALHLAVMLVQWFASGGVRRA